MTNLTSNVHITPHMHWDREWYFTTEESRILLLNNMEEILTRLESDLNYPYYVLDGQTAVLEDFFTIKPEQKERVKKLVQAGKLIIGPWYTQTDTMMVAGESIARNLMYGIRDCREFGPYMKIGYLPDSFGQSSQLPHIFNEFGFEYTLFWRGCSERHGTDKTEFIWQSNDGSKVFAQVLPLGYAIGKYLPNNKQALQDRLDDYFNVLEKASITEEILLPNGHDQMPLQQNIFEIIDALREIYPQRTFKISRFEEILVHIKNKQSKLAVIKGEFNDGKYMRVHRTISSTRMDIKIANAKIENKITNLLEPIATMAWSLGFEYYHGLFEKMWKEILKNHAHDSISCCCSDKVHQEVLMRFILANDMAENLLQFYMRKITDNMPEKLNSAQNQALDKLVLFNCLPYPRTEVINTTIRTKAKYFSLTDGNNNNIEYFICNAKELDPGLIDRQIVHYGNYEPFMEYDIQFYYTVPAMGYTTLHITPTEQAILKTSELSTGNYLENNYYHITIQSNGTLTIKDKLTGQVYDKVLEIEDGSDDGDEYDYSPLTSDRLLYSTNIEQIKIDITHQAWQSIATISYKMLLPENLAERSNNQQNGYLNVKSNIVLAHNSRRIDINIELDNQADDHRVRVLIPTPFTEKRVTADNPFGTITRPIDDEAMKVWQQEQWKEAPIPVWQMLSFAAINSKDGGLAILTEGLREFEIINQNNTFAITLFRSIGVLGKENLELRPGRPSGIKLSTPDSQMRGKLVCNFSLFGFTGDTISANVPQITKEYLTPISYYNKIPFNAMKLNLASFNVPTELSLFTIDSKQLVLSAYKKAEDYNGMIMRIFNPSEQQNKTGNIMAKHITHWQQTSMGETICEPSSELNCGDFGEIKPCQSKTFLFNVNT